MSEHSSMKSLTNGFAAEVDMVDKAEWDEICRDFTDANIYHTWPYAIRRSGPANVSHLLLKQRDTVLGAIQARLLRIPYLPFGVVYVFWGPLWKRRNVSIDVEVFRQ